MSDENNSFESSEELSLESQDFEGTEEQSTEEIQEQVQEQKKKLKALKLKFNGKEIDEELPFEIDEEHAEWMKKQLQMSKLAQSKAQEAAELQKEVVAFIQELKTNPKKALANPMIGLDVKQLAAEILEEEIENSKKTPEQLKIEEYERKLKEIEEKNAQEKAEQERQRQEIALERAYEKYDNMIVSALEANPDLPSNPYIIDKMVKYMSIAVEEGYEPEMDIIANIVREEVNNDVKHLLTVLPVDKVEQLLGQEVLGKLRKSRLESAKKAPPPTKKIAKDVAAVKKQEAPAASKVTIRDFLGV